MMSHEKSGGDILLKIATFIVDKRKFIFLVIIACVIFSLISMGWVQVENDLTAFLPEQSASLEGMKVMMDEFTTPGTAQVMVANVTLDEAWEVYDKILGIKGVGMVEFDETSSHYNNVSAYYSVTFLNAASSDECLASFDTLKADMSSYDSYISSDLGNPMGAILDQEIFFILIIASVMILTMLFLTSKNYLEVPIILITFVVAMMINTGTNFIFGKISFVSNSVTSLLQLALSLDYAVILINKYKEEIKTKGMREAVIAALAKSIPEVMGSSLTTVGGMVAMLFMQFKLGPDMAICLIKAILFAMLSVFIFMPGLLMQLGGIMTKTEHKYLLPNVSFIGKFAYKTRKVVPTIFAVVIIAAIFISGACPFSYGYMSQEATKLNEQSLAKKMISENFGSTNMLALIVPSGDYGKEADLLEELESYDEVKSAMGIANVEAMNGFTLADSLSPRDFSELADIDYEICTLLYAAYAADNSDFGSILGDISDYRVPLIDMFLFVCDQIDSGLVTLEGEQAEMLAGASELMNGAKNQLVGENYSRMIVYIDLPEDSEQTFAFLDTVRETARKYYPDGNVYLVGGSTSAEDFKISFELDNIVVTALSIIIVLVVLLFTFKSVAMPVLLIIVIQGSIWINFSIPSLLETPLFFLGYLIISAIQMGANIDYAIVIATRFNEVKKKMSPRDAIIETMNFAFPTVITSGAIMSVTGILIGYMSSEATISSMGMNLGRGTVISLILVLFVLPQLLLVGDKLVEKTTFRLSSKKASTHSVSGKTRVCGKVDGEINGRIIGSIDALIDGDVNLRLLSSNISDGKEETGDEK